MKTYTLKALEMQRKWWLVDAEGLILGRLATQVAMRLRGKHKPTFTPHMDCGDGVIVINAEKVALTGQKRSDKTFYWHTGYVGGIKERKVGKLLEGPHAERVVTKAVQRMISRNPLGRQQMRHLRVYKGSEHDHEAQAPEVWDIGAQNAKNMQRAVR
jgi:large subunit ribosomal protein L13